LAQAAITPERIAEIQRILAQAGGVVSEASRILNVCQNTVRKYGKQALAPPARAVLTLPEPAPEAGGPSLPEPVPLSYEPLKVTGTGQCLVLSDVHLPYHDKRTCQEAVKDGKARGVTTVLLNGDILDCGGISDHHREPDTMRLEDELATGTQFLAWIRSQFPKARIVYKEGNHEFRLPRFIAANAPELGRLLQIPNLLKVQDYGIEWVQDGCIVELGRLPVIHGHEFRGQGGVNPARWLFLRSCGTAMCGHFHRSSSHDEQGIDRRLHGTWSVGCACYLYPKWLRQNKWNHGWAIVEIHSGDHFTVTNRRLLPDGRVV
jgi:predicted phosphodiesterase